jgi:hypothetical protein
LTSSSSSTSSAKRSRKVRNNARKLSDAQKARAAAPRIPFFQLQCESASGPLTHAMFEKIKRDVRKNKKRSEIDVAEIAA